MGDGRGIDYQVRSSYYWLSKKPRLRNKTGEDERCLIYPDGVISSFFRKGGVLDFQVRGRCYWMRELAGRMGVVGEVCLIYLTPFDGVFRRGPRMGGSGRRPFRRPDLGREDRGIETPGSMFIRGV